MQTSEMYIDRINCTYSIPHRIPELQVHVGKIKEEIHMGTKTKAEDTEVAKSEDNNIRSIAIDKFQTFQFHVFKPKEDESLDKIVESVKLNGIIHPIVARPIAGSDDFEIISGHNRVEAAKRAGLTEVPVVVRELDDDTAIMVANEANIAQRTFSEWLPSEKANSIHQYYTAHRRQGERNDLAPSSSGDNHQRSDEYTRARTALIYGVKENIIRLYYEIHSLSDDLKNRLDNGIFGTTAAQILSRILLTGQVLLSSVLEANTDISTISVAASKKIRKALDSYTGRDNNEEVMAKAEIRKILVRETGLPVMEDSVPSVKIIEMEIEQYQQLFMDMSSEDVISEIVEAVLLHQKSVFAPIYKGQKA